MGILTVDNGLGGVRSRGVAVCARMGISGSNIMRVRNARGRRYYRVEVKKRMSAETRNRVANRVEEERERCGDDEVNRRGRKTRTRGVDNRLGRSHRERY